MSPMYCNAGNGDVFAFATADYNSVLLYDGFEVFQFSVFGGGSKLWCMLRRFARRAAAAAKKIGMRCDGLARAGGVDGGQKRDHLGRVAG